MSAEVQDGSAHLGDGGDDILSGRVIAASVNNLWSSSDSPNGRLAGRD